MQSVLYGRSSEAARVRDVFTAVFEASAAAVAASANDDDDDSPNKPSSSQTAGPGNMLLISGPMGVGKRALVEKTLRPEVQAMGGLLLSVKCHDKRHSFSNHVKSSSQVRRETSRHQHSPPGCSGGTAPSYEVFQTIVVELINAVRADEALLRRVRSSLDCLVDSGVGSSTSTSNGGLDFWDDSLSDVIHQLLRSPPLQQNSTMSSPSRSNSQLGQQSPRLEKALSIETLATSTPNVDKSRSSSDHHRASIRVGHQQHHSNSIPVACRLIKAVAQCVPLVLVLEHIQHADEAIVELCRRLCHDAHTLEQDGGGGDTSSVQQLPLLVVFTYRNDGTVENQKVDSFLQSINLAAMAGSQDVTGRETAAFTMCRSIALSNLTRNDVRSWARDALVVSNGWTESEIKSFVEAAMKLSAGHPLYLAQLFCWLIGSVPGKREAMHMHEAMRQLERHDTTTSREITQLWSFILSTLNANVAALIDMTAALVECGHSDRVSKVLLGDLLDAKDQCQASLCVAQSLGLLQEDTSPTRCSNATGFVHFTSRELQQVVYSLIPTSKVALMHVQIARILWNAHADRDNPQCPDRAEHGAETIPQLAWHFSRGASANVYSIEERCRAAQVSLCAAQLLTRRSEFTSAAECIESGIAILKGDCTQNSLLWSMEQYGVSLALHNGGAEIYYCSGNFDAMQRMLDPIFVNGRSFADKLQAYTTLVYANSSRNRLSEALDMAYDVLQQLGEPLPRNPTKLSVVLSYLRTRWEFRGKTDRFFLNLPPATDAKKIAAMQMVNVAFISLHSVRPHAAALALFRMLQLFVEFGMTGPVIAGVGAYGFVLCTLMQYDQGLRYARLALALLEQFEAREWLPRVYLSVYGYIHYFFYPIHESYEPLQVAQQLAIQSGDMESWASASLMVLICGFHSGRGLVDLEAAAKSYCEMMTSFGQTGRLIFTLPLWKVFSDLTGGSAGSWELPDTSVTDVESAVKRALEEGNTNALAQYYNNCTVFYCLTGEYTKALGMAEHWKKVEGYPDFIVAFYEGIALFAVARTLGWNWRRRRCVRRGAKLTQQMMRWCRKCPANFFNKQCLMQAEWAAAQGNQGRAFSLYDKSIEAALQQGLIHEAALAYERLGRYHCDLGHKISAAPYFGRARDIYKQWGAKLLVARLDELLERG